MKECLAKIIIAWSYFRKILQNVWRGSKYRRTFVQSRVLNMLLIMDLSVFRICNFIGKRWVLEEATIIFDMELFFKFGILFKKKKQLAMLSFRYFNLWTYLYFPEFYFLELFVLLHFRMYKYFSFRLTRKPYSRFCQTSRYYSDPCSSYTKE